MHFTTEEWEQAVLKDKEDLNAHLSQVPSSTLDQTIQSGLAKGKKRHRFRQKRRIGMIWAAAAASLFILFTASIRVSPAFAAIVSELPLMNKFVEVVRYNSVYANAIDSNLLQEVNIQTSVGKSTLTIGGLIADENRLTVLYSLKGTEAKATASKFSWFAVKDSNGKVIGNANHNSSVSNTDDTRSEVYTRAQFEMSEGETLADSVVISGDYKGQLIEVPLRIDQSRYAGKKEIISIHKTIEIGGQRVTFEKLIITPLQAKIKITADPKNKKQINDFMNLTLTDDTGYKRRVQGVQGNIDESGRYYIFESPYYDNVSTLTLEAEGLHLNDKGQIFQFNTVTEETISTPDARISLENVEKSGKEITVSILFEDITNKEYGDYVLMPNKDELIHDANGTSFPLKWSGLQFVSEKTTTKTIRYQYSFPEAEYAQPLKLNIQELPGYIEEKIQIPVK
ncbi:DUF4179 domain-containing protein [Neobacillus mesonae]|nr:DUF4179 domain-containing protein [Neobacillus mesonae]